MADILNEEQVAKLQVAFCAIDLDRDGVIAAKDLENVLRFLGQNPSEAELQVLLMMFVVVDIIDALAIIDVVAVIDVVCDVCCCCC